MSMRARLFGILIAATGLLWLSATAWVYFSTEAQVERVLDARLREAARMVSSLIDSQEIGTAVASLDAAPLPDPQDATYERQLSCQIWSLSGDLVGKSASAPTERLSDHTEGFAERTIDGETWRVYAVQNEERGVQVLVGDNLDIRSRLVNDVVKGLAIPMALILPALAVILWIGVGRGLQPLSSLASTLRRRDADDLRPFPDSGPKTAAEIRPLIESLNELFNRLEDMRGHERQFLAYAAHELKTPLSGLKTQAEIALKSDKQSVRSTALSNILTGVTRTTRLVRQLLAMAEAEAATADTHQVRLSQVVQEAVAGHTTGADDPEIRLHIDPDLDDIDIATNETLLVLALRNLIENAQNHSPPGGSVEIRWTGAGIAVEDEGPGMSDEEIDRATDPFFRGSNRTPIGSGLGLAIVDVCARKLGGRLVLSRRAPAGLCAEIRFLSETQ
ncbi:Sensor protein QseC [Methyloligella halotolerans]|uniref:histidine kinase n=1 Tax=Methyloligella halotolerans TaxID=1177755 RepID=A0A1E2RUP6_9HYPH|nr:ATP-binding protein [Methyloligella halotolerans]ODA65943.1 Sensor protein QseC [Methyloligella halotolerans]